MIMITSLVVSFALTLVLETGIFLIYKRGKFLKKDLLLVVLVNIITNPIVVLAYWLVMLYTGWNIVIVIILLETFAVLTEGYCYKKYGHDFKHPYLFSFVANTFSFGIGMLIGGIF